MLSDKLLLSHTADCWPMGLHSLVDACMYASGWFHFWISLSLRSKTRDQTAQLWSQSRA